MKEIIYTGNIIVSGCEIGFTCYLNENYMYMVRYSITDIFSQKTKDFYSPVSREFIDSSFGSYKVNSEVVLMFIKQDLFERGENYDI